MSFILKQESIAILLLLISASCAAIPGKNVKLENYPKVKKEEIKNLSLSYQYSDFIEVRDGRDTSVSIDAKLKKMGVIKTSENSKGKCEIIARANSGVYSFWGCPIITNLLSIPTLGIIPYYCQQTYQAHARLMSSYDNRVLKEYDLKEKVHEILSSLMFLAAIPIKSLRDIPTPEYAKKITEEKLSEALVRSILNDASKFNECRK